MGKNKKKAKKTKFSDYVKENPKLSGTRAKVIVVDDVFDEEDTAELMSSVAVKNTLYEIGDRSTEVWPIDNKEDTSEFWAQFGIIEKKSEKLSD